MEQVWSQDQYFDETGSERHPEELREVYFCPFCGELEKVALVLKWDNERDSGYCFVKCCRCGGSGPSKTSATLAIHFWNERVLPAMDDCEISIAHFLAVHGTKQVWIGGCPS